MRDPRGEVRAAVRRQALGAALERPRQREVQLGTLATNAAGWSPDSR